MKYISFKFSICLGMFWSLLLPLGVVFLCMSCFFLSQVYAANITPSIATGNFMSEVSVSRRPLLAFDLPANSLGQTFTHSLIYLKKKPLVRAKTNW